MKKLLTIMCLCLTVLMMASFAGCGKNENASEATTEAATEVTTEVTTEATTEAAAEKATEAVTAAPQWDTDAADADVNTDADTDNSGNEENQADEQDYQGREDHHGAITRMSTEDAINIVLNSTDYTRDEVASADVIQQDGSTFFAISFYRNGTNVFYVRDSDGSLLTHEQFDAIYYPAE